MRMLRDVLFRPEMGRPRDWGELEALDRAGRSRRARCSRSAPSSTARSRPRRRAGSRRPRPNGELLMIEGAGHFPFAEAPDRYWPAVEAWLLRTATGTGA